jgi:protein-S-isoprenylcysteine O-methyltransferase Ste14
MLSSYLVAGSGFLLVVVSDVLQGRKATAMTVPLSWAGYALVALSVLSLVLRSDLAPVSVDALTISGIGLSVFFSGLLIYSVCFEIPLAEKRTASPKKQAFMKGTYGFSRHPGFLWFTILQCTLWPVHQDGGSLALSAWMVLLDFILICLEDRFLFPRIFVDYAEYKKKVPFLVPVPGMRK